MLYRIEIIYNNKIYKCNHSLEMQASMTQDMDRPIVLVQSFMNYPPKFVTTLTLTDSVCHSLLVDLYKSGDKFIIKAYQVLDKAISHKFEDCVVHNVSDNGWDCCTYSIKCEGNVDTYLDEFEER